MEKEIQPSFDETYFRVDIEDYTHTMQGDNSEIERMVRSVLSPYTINMDDVKSMIRAGKLYIPYNTSYRVLTPDRNIKTHTRGTAYPKTLDHGHYEQTRIPSRINTIPVLYQGVVSRIPFLHKNWWCIRKKDSIIPYPLRDKLLIHLPFAQEY